MSFREKLHAAIQRNESLLCVGLDPDPKRIPVADSRQFLQAIIEATADLVCAFKPQLAFFESEGLDGWHNLRAVLEAVPGDIPIILDAKRGDVPHAASAYASACFDVLGADAVTVNPYMGGDSLRPFFERSDRGVFVLCRTSNSGALELQDLLVDGDPLYMRVAELAQQWGTSHNNAGLVVGATYPRELAAVRARCPNLPILLPGIGAQGGDLEAALHAGLDKRGAGLVVSASRSVLYASRGSDFASASRTEAKRLRDAINNFRPTSSALSG